MQTTQRLTRVRRLPALKVSDWGFLLGAKGKGGYARDNPKDRWAYAQIFIVKHLQGIGISTLDENISEKGDEKCMLPHTSQESDL